MLSVVIPTFGRTQSLGRLLEALQAQHQCDKEIILVDQNRPGWLLEQLTKEQIRGTKLIHLTDPNVSAARNVGFQGAVGDIVLFIDDDLIPDPEFCSRALEIFQSNPEVGCLCPVVYGAEGRAQATQSALETLSIGDTPPEGTLHLIRETISAALFFRHDYFARTGGFDALLFRYARAAEDQEFFLRMRLRRLSAWLDVGLAIFHDENVPGGCGLRTADYWKTREKCVRSWVFRYRIHGERGCRLTPAAVWRLSRSALLNYDAVAAGPRYLAKHALFLLHAIKDSRQALADHAPRYVTVQGIDHFERR